VIKVLLFGLTTLSSTFGQTQITVPAPNFPRVFVGKPEFSTKVGNRSAGTACLVRFEGNPQIYLLTVRHLLGPSGGFPQLISPPEVPSFVSAIRLLNIFGAGSKVYRVTGLSVPETLDHKAPLFNVAIFKTNDAFPSDAVAATLNKPALGETVWVVANVRTSSDQSLHSAKVANNGDRWLIAEFDEQGIVPNGASGAPVLNATGKILGIYCTHDNKEGKVRAFIIPSALFAQVIAQQTTVH
jgi:hypothetical protein